MSAIQWYPGHMTKARRNIEADLKLVDLIIELRDARVPFATKNPDIERITKGKKRLILLNKADLADPEQTKKWISALSSDQTLVIALDSRTKNSLAKIRQAISELMKEKREKDLSRGLVSARAVKAMVLGIPNVGKSTLINSLTGKSSAITGNKPGVTKGNQWINAGSDLMLLDTPGVLWPKFEDKKVGLNLASIGSINDEILNKEELAMYLADYLYKKYPEALKARYQFTEERLEDEVAAITEEIPGLNKTALAILKCIAENRNCIKKGAQPDYEKAARCFIDDFRSGRLGRITLEEAK